MAIQTRTLGVAVDETTDTIATLQVDYDDVALRLTAVRILNPTSKPTFVTARRASGGGPTYTMNGAPGQTTEQAIPGSAAARLGVSIDAQGRLDGVDYTFGFGTV